MPAKLWMQRVSLAALMCAAAVSGAGEAAARGETRQDGRAAKPQRTTLSAVSKASEARPAEAKAAETRGPLVIVVSLREQELKVYDGDDEIARSRVSSGRSGYETPTGVFSILQKNRIHFSNLYDDAPMPNMQRLTWSGVALHAGALPGYPASHGCIRLPHAFSRDLFGITRLGTRVIVTRDRVAPQEIAHERLARLSAPASGGASTALVPDETGPLMTGAVDRPADIMRLGVGRPAEATPPSVGGALTIASVGGGAERSATAAPSLMQQAVDDVARATAALDQAREARSQSEEAAKAAVLAARTAREAVLAARGELDRLRRALQATERETEAMRGRFRALLQSFERMDEAQRIKAAETEASLESEIERRAADEASAGEAVEAAARTLATLTEALEKADDARAVATGTYSSAAAAERLAIETLKTARRTLERRKLPASIFVSRKTGRLYVRQGNEPVLEAPVAISGEGPIGTHVFTALDRAPGSTAPRWSVVSIGGTRASEATLRAVKSRRDSEAAPRTVQAASTAAEALARLEIPAETMAQLAEIVRTGSSLLIADTGLSSETGKHTDFILSTQ